MFAKPDLSKKFRVMVGERGVVHWWVSPKDEGLFQEARLPGRKFRAPVQPGPYWCKATEATDGGGGRWDLGGLEWTLAKEVPSQDESAWGIHSLRLPNPLGVWLDAPATFVWDEQGKKWKRGDEAALTAIKDRLKSGESVADDVSALGAALAIAPKAGKIFEFQIWDLPKSMWDLFPFGLPNSAVLKEESVVVSPNRGSSKVDVTLLVVQVEIAQRQYSVVVGYKSADSGAAVRECQEWLGDAPAAPMKVVTWWNQMGSDYHLGINDLESP